MVLVACALPLCGARAQKVGVALSGGAARGLAHIGVLRVLEEAGVPVDVITGTSMGSVIGGLYAVGYTAAQLDTIVRTEDWLRLLTDPVDRRDLAVDRKFTEDHYLVTLPIERGGIKLPRSVVPGQRVSQLLTGLTWSAHPIRDFRALPIPFAAVATDLETSKAVVLDHGFLPDAIRASMALPSVFSPVELADTSVIDGGVIRNLAAQGARGLGRVPPSARPAGVALVRAESLLVTTVRFDPADLVPGGFLARALGVKPGTWVSRRTLDQRMSRLYATGLFESVGYRLDRGDLTVVLRQRSGGRFGVGLRYDSRYKASVLLSSTLGRVAGGVSARADARLGQQIQVGAGVSQPLGDGRSLTLGAGADYVRSPFDLYQGDHRVAQARVDLAAISTSVARSAGTLADATLSAKVEYARWAEEVSAVASNPLYRSFYSVAGVLQLDSYDRGLFPHSGVGFRAVSEWGNRLGAAAGGGPFSHHVADLRGYLPLARRLSLWAGATIGASGGEPPPHYQFFLGGANAYYLFPDRDIAFAGLRTQQQRGRHVQKAELGAQWELAPDVFARVRWNAGTVLDRWSFDPARYVQGAGVELGAKTFAGRLSLSASGNAHTTWPIVEIDLGYPF